MGTTNLDSLKLSGTLSVGSSNIGAGDLAVTGNLTVTGITTLTTKLDKGQLAQPNADDTIHFFVAGGQTTGTKKAAAIVGVAGTIVDVRAYLDTAPVGSTFIVDVMKNGVTLFTTSGNRPIVADGGNASSTTLPDVTTVAAGDRLRVDNIQIGSGTAGSDLYVSVTIKRNLVA